VVFICTCTTSNGTVWYLFVLVPRAMVQCGV